MIPYGVKKMKINNKFENKIKSLINKKKFISVELQLLTNNEIINHSIFHADHSRKKLSISDRPIYRIYSMTKPIVSLASLIALEQKKLCLNDPVKKYLPYFDNIFVQLPSGKMEPLNRPISILDLLTHNSGLSYGFNFDCHIGRLYKKDKLIHKSDLSLAEFVSQISEYPIAFQPGNDWRYSLATDVLARVLEIIFDGTIENILSKLIFTPLEMVDTGYFVSSDKSWRLMPIYGEPDLDNVADKTSEKKQLHELNLENFYSPKEKSYKARGGHGLFSTVNDYTKFCTALLQEKYNNTNRIISKKLLNYALNYQIPNQQVPIKLNGEAHLGYGWNLLGRASLKKIRIDNNSYPDEFGWAGAASTYFWINPNLKTTGVVMTQHLGQEYPIGEKCYKIYRNTLHKQTQ